MPQVRTIEQKKMEKLYQEHQNTTVLLYGTSYSGKEDFIRTFIKDKDAFYYRCRDISPEEQKRLFLEEIRGRFGSVLKEESYEEGFRRMRSKDGSRLVIVLDEFQFLARRDTEILSALTSLKAKKLYPGPVMIVLAASNLSWVVRDFDETVGSYRKQINERIKLGDVSFLDVVRTFPSFSVPDAVKTYGILGGIPAFLEVWSGQKSIRDNVIDTILKPDAPLHDASHLFLLNELRELSVYNTILASNARGNEKLNDLYKDTGFSRAKISVYMKNLAAFDVIEKAVSFETGGWDNTKKGVYHIGNHFLRFWFTFIYPHASALEVMTPGDFYDKYIAPDLDAFLQPDFVMVCSEYLELMNMVGKTPIRLKKMGTWIGKKGTIDIVGQNEVRENIVAVCNWDEKEFPYSRYQLLVENMDQARIKAKVIYLFSATEFDPMVKNLANHDTSVVLVDMKEL